MVHHRYVQIAGRIVFLIVTGTLALALACGGSLHAQDAPGQAATTPEQRVRLAAQAVVANDDQSTGLFHGTGWWNSANGVTALVDASRALGTHEFDPVLKHTFATAPTKFPGYLNEFYDDEGWWALAWLDAYELRKDPHYLQTADAIFTDMTGGWSDTCGGGIWWKKNEHYKNAIANELFLSVSTQLAQNSKGAARAKYLDWAKREERWFLSSGMINADSLVNDGLDSACQNNHRDTWSYNQGVLLTGLARLSALTGDATALQTANRIATAAAKHMTDVDGVIHDPCEPECGADGVQFKGIFMRNLSYLNQVAPAEVYRNLIRSNAESVWTRARTPDDHFSVDWAGPTRDSGTGAQISALDALVAGLRLQGTAAPAK